MAETTIRTLVCSVMFLDIVDYSKHSVGDQQHTKQMFNELLARALEPVPPRDFIVLDAGDGAAIAFLGDPEDALSEGIAVRRNTASRSPDTPRRSKSPRASDPDETNLDLFSTEDSPIVEHGTKKARHEKTTAAPAKIFEAGANLIVSGSSKASVEEALDRLAKGGAEVISHITQVGDKWMASCTNPDRKSVV